jgi:hypothetical protein
MSEAADRLERLARVMRDIPVTDQTTAFIELQCEVIEQILAKSPTDAAPFAASVAKLMRG